MKIEVNERGFIGICRELGISDNIDDNCIIALYDYYNNGYDLDIIQLEQIILDLFYYENLNQYNTDNNTNYRTIDEVLENEQGVILVDDNRILQIY